MTHTRREFTKATKREAFTRSNGICECHRVRTLPTYRTGCGVRLSSGNVFYEHIEQDAIGGSNTIENCAALSKTCWKLKTATIDLPHIAKQNRQRDRERGTQTLSFRPLPGTKRSGIKLPLRPFSKPIDRTTGEEWGRK